MWWGVVCGVLSRVRDIAYICATKAVKVHEDWVGRSGSGTDALTEIIKCLSW